MTSYKEEIDPLLEEEEEIEESSFLKLVKILVVFIILGGLIFISGLREYYFLSRTPPGARQPVMESLISEENIELPLKIFLIRENDNGTIRKKENIPNLIENASNIWNQADISFKIIEKKEKDFSPREVSLLKEGNFQSLTLKENKINIILISSLESLNGVAYPSRNAIILPDYTSGYDFRVLGHEIGHILGLGHVENNRYLMSQAAQGNLLSLEEVKKAREIAYEKFRKEK